MERDKAKEVDALAQVFQISSDLVKSRLLISQVETTAICLSYIVNRFYKRCTRQVPLISLPSVLLIVLKSHVCLPFYRECKRRHGAARQVLHLTRPP